MAARLPGLPLDPQHLIIGVNVYTQQALNADAAALADLAQYRVWVTETGVSDESQHIAYVEQMYPKLRTELRAERIYWYALWSGDSGRDRAFGLIHGPTTRTVTFGSLFQLLTQAG